MDGDTKLLDKTLFLGNFSWFQMSPASKIFTIDLKQAGLEEYLKDGLIQVSVLAGDLCWNDFSLNEIGINMTSVAPVPEPGTMALFSVGLLGIAVYGKRRTNKMTA
ncbi:MAG: PEP-CTERM sorting domain-containing protein [Candidatus Moranbacteria bacterium]|nr:PEP-CTERM sorting domain-containing protein [Candidatus Moranbacteria bacterium]